MQRPAFPFEMMELYSIIEPTQVCGELKNVESEEDDPDTKGRRRKKTATERDAEIYKGARSKYALTDGQDAEVMR
jgi:hypothetical protein